MKYRRSKFMSVLGDKVRWPGPPSSRPVGAVVVVVSLLGAFCVGATLTLNYLPTASAQATGPSSYNIPDRKMYEVATNSQWDVTITETGADLSTPGGCTWQTIVEGLTLSGEYSSANLGSFAHSPAPLNDPMISFYGTTSDNVGMWSVRYRFICNGGSSFSSGGRVFYIKIHQGSATSTTTTAPVTKTGPTTTTTSCTAAASISPSPLEFIYNSDNYNPGGYVRQVATVRNDSSCKDLQLKSVGAYSDDPELSRFFYDGRSGCHYGTILKPLGTCDSIIEFTSDSGGIHYGHLTVAFSGGTLTDLLVGRDPAKASPLMDLDNKRELKALSENSLRLGQEGLIGYIPDPATKTGVSLAKDVYGAAGGSSTLGALWAGL